MIDQSVSECFLISPPAVYRIRVSGRLDPEWSERLHGMMVTVFKKKGQAAYTELSAMFPDQAALMGALQIINLCTADPTDPLYHQAVNFCHGYLVGAHDYYKAVHSGPKAFKLVCLPEIFNPQSTIFNIIRS